MQEMEEKKQERNNNFKSRHKNTRNTFFEEKIVIIILHIFVHSICLLSFLSLFAFTNYYQMWRW